MKPNDFIYPEMIRIKQTLDTASLTDAEAAVKETLAACPAIQSASPGATVAIAVGSRGITAIDKIIRACVDFLKVRGLQPFVVPAMGSHGGVTPEGQTAVLAGLNITEASVGASINADMATDSLGELPCGMPVLFSRAALSADVVLPVNRVKPHTKFIGPVESGLAKMLAVGCGKAAGAAQIHRFAIAHSFDVIRQAAEYILEKVNVLCGLAVLEDGAGQTAHVEAIAPAGMIDREKELLKKAYEMLPHIPFNPIDVLIVDRIGKNISGIGMDSNITGRHRDITGDIYTAPHVKRIFVRDLTPESGGNANGIGLADFTTTRLVNAMDREKTYTNALTAISPEKAAIPLYFDSDREAIAAAIKSCGLAAAETARIVRISDTAHLENMAVSRAMEKEIAGNPDLSKAGEWEVMRFDKEDNLQDE